MGKFINTALAAGLSAGLAAGCGGESAVEQEAQITGFARAIDAQIVEDQWVTYRDEPDMPIGARLLDKDREFDHCREVGNGLFELGMDDSECWFRWDCNPEEGEHCEAVYRDEYDYEVLEEVVAEECPAPIRPVEYKREEPISDEACMARRGDGQRLKKTSRFIIWVRTPNPNYEVDKPQNGPAFLEGSQDISAEEWQQVDRQVDVTAKIKGGRIIDVEVKG